jgi:hypothetical protein
MKRETLHALNRESLGALLSEAGLLDAFEAGQTKCAGCRQPVTWGNLYSVFLEDGQIRFVCDAYSCYEMLRARVNSEGS